MQLDDEAWADVRAAYADASVSLSQIAERFGLTRQRITARAKKEGWAARPVAVRRRAAKLARESHEPDAAAGNSAAAAKTSRRRAALPTRGAQRALIGRLYRAISLKLEHMEVRMASGEIRSAQDEERESRALATLISNFEKVTEAVAELDRDKDGARDAGRVGTDAERMRREIADRLERLGGGRTAGGGSREPGP